MAVAGLLASHKHGRCNTLPAPREGRLKKSAHKGVSSPQILPIYCKNAARRKKDLPSMAPIRARRTGPPYPRHAPLVPQ